MEKLNNIGIGLTGVAGSEAVQLASEVSEMPISEGMKAITQIIIAIATLVSLFRKPKKV